METRNSRGTIAEALGGTGTQRGVKLGIVAGCVSIFLLFGASAWQHGSSSTVNLDSGQITSLIPLFLPGFLAILIAAVLAYYAGLSGPDAKSGAGGRDGLIAGSITMLLFWVGQTLFVLVDGLRSSQGLELSTVVSQRFIAAVLFFVIGGMLGWGGSRAAARRARSILASPTSSLLSLIDPGSDKPGPDNQLKQPATQAPGGSSEEREAGKPSEKQEAPVDAPAQKRDT